MRLPQAIFTSVRGKRLDGYQLASRSDEIDDDLARDLHAWGPAHDSLLYPREGIDSINFHPLQGGQWYCLSRTLCAGAEYSGRSGGRVYTQMFLLSPDGLARFANNPFLVLRALRAAGRLLVYDEVPETLRSLPLVGRAANHEVEEQNDELSAGNLSTLETALKQSPSVAVLGTKAAEPWFAALFRRLPLEERPRVSFSTGLKPSMGRPFRLFVAPDDAAQQRQLSRQSGVCIVELRGGNR
jgi:GTPase-associated protein 1